MAAAIRSRISDAAALVKVTRSSCVMSMGFSGSVTRRSTRSVSTAVLPEPAAAETSSEPPRFSIAFFCSLVHSGIVVTSQKLPYLTIIQCLQRALAVACALVKMAGGAVVAEVAGHALSVAAAG